jgi:hypothetical protein
LCFGDWSFDHDWDRGWYWGFDVDFELDYCSGWDYIWNQDLRLDWGSDDQRLAFGWGRDGHCDLVPDSGFDHDLDYDQKRDVDLDRYFVPDCHFRKDYGKDRDSSLGCVYDHWGSDQNRE